MLNGVVGWMFGSGAGDPGGGWIMVQWPWKARCDGKIFLDWMDRRCGHQVKIPAAAHCV